MITTPTSTLDLNRVVSYFKQTMGNIFLQRTSDGDMLIANTFCVVRVPKGADLSPFVFPDDWTRATLLYEGRKSRTALKSSPFELEAQWKQLEAFEVECVLKLTHELWESPDISWGKPGLLLRKLLAGDTPVYYNKCILDLFSPDLGELEGFLFEHPKGVYGLLRVSARYGPVAYLHACKRKEDERSHS